jgi:hypothetical protein
MSQNKKTLIHTIICTLMLFVVLMVFVLLGYIDFSVIRTIYLPIYVVVIAAILFRQYLFSYLFTASACFGLIIEYLIRSSQEFPTMGGAFANTLILILGFAIGVIAQIMTRIRRANEKSNSIIEN